MHGSLGKMTCVWCFWLLVVVLAFVQGCEAFDSDIPKARNRSTDVRVVPDEHLFTAGNDTSGTAAVTFTSRLNSEEAPTIKQFTNHSFPRSCASHPTRCCPLTYSSYRFNGTNLTRLIFYVPLAGSDSAALGLMELWHDGATISQINTTAQIAKTPHQCDPVSVVNIPKIGVYLICAAGDGYSLMLCEVRNSNNISEASLSCTSPQFLSQPLTNFLLLSNFVIYRTPRPFIFYFVYGSDLYQMTHVGLVTHIHYLPTSDCRYVHLERVNASFLIVQCYERDKIRTFYFNVDLHQYIPDDANIARYHCPNPEQYVTVSPSQLALQPRVTQASYQESGVDQGRFNLNASQVTYAKCFSFRNQTHFLYEDPELGVFIKPNISVDLRSRLVQVSNSSCGEDQACKQPMIFGNRYLILTNNVDDLHHQQVSAFDLYRGLMNRTLSLVTSSTAQFAFVSELTGHIIPVKSTSPPENGSPSSKTIDIGITIGVSFAVILTLLGICVVAAFILKWLIHVCSKEGKVHRTGHYAPVAHNTKDLIKLNDTKRPQDDNDHQSRHLLNSKENSPSPTPPPTKEGVTEHDSQSVIANLETLASQKSEADKNVSQSIINVSSEELASDDKDLPHRRSQYSIAGASQDGVPASQQCTQPSIHSAGLCGSFARQPCMTPTCTSNSDGSPRSKFHPYGMPLLECNESPSAPASSATDITRNSEVHDTTGVTHRRPPQALLRQSSLPNPPRPRPQHHDQWLRQSPHLQRSSSNNDTNTVTSTTNTHVIASSRSLAHDNDLEYQRQQRLCQPPSPTPMNSSDSAYPTLSRTSSTSSHTPPIADSARHPAIPNNTNTYNQAHYAWQPSHSNGTILESKPESGRQTGTMLVTGKLCN